MQDHIIEASHLSKKFARSLRRAMVYGLRDLARAALLPRRFRSPGLAGRLADGASSGLPAAPAPLDEGLRESEFWALRDVCFAIRPGECVGVIGNNGAGKSTLFSLLSGIYEPTGGRAVIRGRLQALIALGAGFHPVLSGRENIYISASIFGLTTRQIDALMERIIDFSELGPFIDAPVKTYSSGMYVKLGFSVAAHLDPDILLIDEVLAVGDASFQEKCIGHSRKMVNAGKTIMLVSHNLVRIQAMAQRAIWLEHGRVVRDGPTQTVVEAYKESVIREMAERKAGAGESLAGRPAVIRRVELLDASDRIVTRLRAGERASARLFVSCQRAVPVAQLWLVIYDAVNESPLVSASMFDDGHAVRLEAGESCIRVDFETLPLRGGARLRLSAGLREPAGEILLADSFATDPVAVDGDVHCCLQGRGGLKPLKLDARAPIAAGYRWTVDGAARLDDLAAGGAPSAGGE